MPDFHPINRYFGPRPDNDGKAGRVPVINAQNRGWQGDLDDARGYAASVRISGSKEMTAIAIMAIGKYTSAIEKMQYYNENAGDPDVTKEINIAKSELVALQKELTTD